mmetsp:Transcript_10996/g.30394  ORF Transcript_10996/g.30394 Transcript_10996/m.30394 type:complete len:447 (-) Transcript_10996:181-1521(-)
MLALPSLVVLSAFDAAKIPRQILVAIKLMHHRTDCAIPILDHKPTAVGRLFHQLAIAPLFERFAPQGGQIIHNPRSLIKHDNVMNAVGIRQFLTVVQAIVKPLIGSHEDRASFVGFGHHRSQIGFNGHGFAHGGTGTNDWLVGQRVGDFHSVRLTDPSIIVLGRFANVGRFYTFAKQVQEAGSARRIRSPRYVGKGIGLKNGIASVHQQYPTAAVVRRHHGPINFVANVLQGAGSASVGEWFNVIIIIASIIIARLSFLSIHLMQMTGSSPAIGRLGFFPLSRVTDLLGGVHHHSSSIGIIRQVLVNIIFLQIVGMHRQDNIPVVPRGSETFNELRVHVNAVFGGKQHDGIVIRTVLTQDGFQCHDNFDVVVVVMIVMILSEQRPNLLRGFGKDGRSDYASFVAGLKLLQVLRENGRGCFLGRRYIFFFVFAQTAAECGWLLLLLS